MGCATEPMVTHINSEPPGARIEVNEGFVGITPMDVILPQRGEHHRLREAARVRALPEQATQYSLYPQEKFLFSHQEAPSTLIFDMRTPPPAK